MVNELLSFSVISACAQDTVLLDRVLNSRSDLLIRRRGKWYVMDI